jgi:hypothetical protein
LDSFFFHLKPVKRREFLYPVFCEITTDSHTVSFSYPGISKKVRPECDPAE